MQVLPAVQRKSFGDRLNEGIGRGLETAQRFQQESIQQQANARNRQAIQELTGMDLEDPEMQKEAFSEVMKGQSKQKLKEYEFSQLENLINKKKVVQK